MLFAGSGGGGVALDVVAESAACAVVFSSPVDVVGDLDNELSRHEVEVAVSVVSGNFVEVGAFELEVGSERVQCHHVEVEIAVFISCSKPHALSVVLGDGFAIQAFHRGVVGDVE